MNAICSKEYLTRRTFAIVSHPDAGKTTLTEKFLLLGGVIQTAGTIKARKATHYTTSDWMALEKERGISVTTSAMQFPYQNCVFNLLDTPGHADFSEDTYRTLTAVDTALMVIDAAKGVESRTKKLLEVCRLRKIPIVTFINKMDRESYGPIELMDAIEKSLNIICVPITWPIGIGSQFKGIYHLLEDRVYLYTPINWASKQGVSFLSLDHSDVKNRIEAYLLDELREELALIKGTGAIFNKTMYKKGKLTPVFFGSAINNFGVTQLLSGLVKFALCPQPRKTEQRKVYPEEPGFSGFVFKIQANMDSAHRDRVAFLRICSGKYTPGIKLLHVRTQREMSVQNALTFMAGDRIKMKEAWPGDIIGLHNHGTIQVGDSFTMGEALNFIGFPSFSPELFRRVRLQDPMKSKALIKGLLQLSEEGAIQIFRPLASNELILGAIGLLQFDVVAYRLKHEYRVQCAYETVNIMTACWVKASDPKRLDIFRSRNFSYLACDAQGSLSYLAPNRIHLNLMKERWPDISFLTIKEI